MIKGDAITAGSNPSFFANMGSEQPTSFATKTVTTSVRHTTAATWGVTLSTTISFTKLVTARVAPDIKGSMAHALMLGNQGIISHEEAELIHKGLTDIYNDIEAGRLEIDMTAEDIHSFVEATLTERIGDAGKKLHTGRSRNDQVALDMRMYSRNAAGEISKKLKKLLTTILTIL